VRFHVSPANKTGSGFVFYVIGTDPTAGVNGADIILTAADYGAAELICAELNNPALITDSTIEVI
jgi:hypothetical protein